MEKYFEDEQLNEEEIIPEFIEQPIKVYIKVNSNNEITDINSDIFIKDLTGWIYIDEGFGDRFAHSQSQYFDKPLVKEDGHYNYKYINGGIVEQ